MTEEPDPRTAFETSGTDLETARAMYQDAYGGSHFVASHTDREFSYRFRSTGDDRFSFRSTLFYGRMRGEVEVSDQYVVTWATEGGGVIDVGRDEVLLRPGTPVMFPTGRPFAFDLADIRQSLVQFERVYLETVAAEVHGGAPAPLVFDHAREPAPDALRAWRMQVQEAARVVLGTARTTRLALAETTHATALALLRTFPHHVVADEIALPQGATGRVRSAVEYMHANAHTPITTTDVAEHVGLSARGLQQAFQRQVGTAPNALLRGIRLDRVHDELRRSSPGAVTVAAVASRWGFAHLGRFSAAYAARFGEYPKDTLTG